MQGSPNSVSHEDANFEAARILVHSIQAHPARWTLDFDWSGFNSKSHINVREALLGDLISKLEILKTLHLHPLTSEAKQLPASAALPLLEELHISFPHDSPGTMASLSLGSSAFPSLKALKIHHTSLQHASIAEFIKLIKSVTSTTLSLFEFTCKDFKTVCDVLQVVVSKWSAILTTVHLDINSKSGGYTGKTVQFEPLLVLTRCPNVKDLRIEYVDPLEVLDKHFDAMSSAWPKLHNLLIYDQTHKEPDEGPMRAKATRRGLQLLATRCPLLRRLAVSINFDKKSKPSSSSTSRLEDHHCIWSSCTDADSAVEFLHRLFPRLMAFGAYNVDGYDEGEDGEDRSMDAVIDLLGLADCPDLARW